MNSVTATGSPVPAPIQLARTLIAVVTISHIVIPIVMSANRSALDADIAGQHPEFRPVALAKSVDIALMSAWTFHGIVLLLGVFLIWKLSSARPWTRRLTTISQLLAVVFSIVSWSSSSMFHAVIPIIDLVQIVIVVILWGPQSARTFFMARVPARSAG